VASGQITIYDDPTIPGFRGSYNIDDEGTLPEKTLLVEAGILKEFLQDKLSARLMGQKANGHGRREDFTNWPLPRMSNTYIAPGKYSAEEINSVRSKKAFMSAVYPAVRWKTPENLLFRSP